MKKENEEKIINVMRKAKELGWINWNEIYNNMRLEEVEKCLLGILEPEYIDNLIKITNKIKEVKK